MRSKERENDLDREDLRQSPAIPKMFFDNRIKRKNVLALNEKVAAIREYEKVPVYKRIGRKFHCSPDQIKRIIQQKDNILQAWEQRTRRCQDAKTLEMKVVRVSMLGKAVYDWIRRMMYYKDFNISDGLIQKMALQFKSAMGLQNFFPHQEWCDKFRQTYKISHMESKLLPIGYTQGYSVQINDVMRDVLSECTPDIVEQDSNEELHDENDAVGLDVKPTTKDENANDTSTASQSLGSTSKARPVPALQPIHQLVALPIQSRGNGPQKVLVATPISGPAAQRPGAPPMTMTIIPLATIGKPPHATANTSASATPSLALEKTTPPPMVAIKQEIKEEPAEEPQIKQEILSDDEEAPESVSRTSTPIASPSGFSPPTQSTFVPADPQEKVTLLRLHPFMQKLNNHSSSGATIVTSTTSTGVPTKSTKTTASGKAVRPVVVVSPPSLLAASSYASCPASPLPISAAKQTVVVNGMPPLPPLTRAPNTATATNSSNSSGNKRNTRKRQHVRDSPQPPLDIPAITSCTEARKYLKLLEDFALHKENFRLIALITRADEVLRELDGDDDVDVD